MDESLTLNKAVNTVPQAESISNQQSIVRNDSSVSVTIQEIGVMLPFIKKLIFKGVGLTLMQQVWPVS